MADTKTAEPGRWVSSYLWQQAEGRHVCMRGLVDFYQRSVLIVFLRFIYPFSLTAWLIRHR